MKRILLLALAFALTMPMAFSKAKWWKCPKGYKLKTSKGKYAHCIKKGKRVYGGKVVCLFTSKYTRDYQETTRVEVPILV